MAETFKNNVVIDVKDHLVGRVCSVVAKELLRGNHVTLVRCEGIYISGNFYRNKLIMLEKMNKRTATNPKEGPFYHRAQCMVVKRMIRGMLPNRTVIRSRPGRKLANMGHLGTKSVGNTKKSLSVSRLNVWPTPRFGTTRNKKQPLNVMPLSNQSPDKLKRSIRNSPLWVTKAI